jgi:hypothetical protein
MPWLEIKHYIHRDRDRYGRDYLPTQGGVTLYSVLLHGSDQRPYTISNPNTLYMRELTRPLIETLFSAMLKTSNNQVCRSSAPIPRSFVPTL